MATPLSDASGLYNLLMTQPPQSTPYVLTADISMVSSGFPTKSIPAYSGIFDGSGFTITIDINDISGFYFGLFSGLSGTVKKLTVIYTSTGTPSITQTLPGVNPTFGLLVATNSGGTIEYSSVRFDTSCNAIVLSDTGSANSLAFGSIVGINTLSTAIINNCSATYDTDITFDISANNTVYAGGICGWNLNSADISGCTLDISGDALFKITSLNQQTYIGGICGLNQSSSIITNTTSNIVGNTTFRTTSLIDLFVGGLCGRNISSNISGSSVIYSGTLDISGSSTNAPTNIGGVCGQNSSTSNILSSSSGILGNTTIRTTSQAASFLGGFCGRNLTSSTISVSSVTYGGAFDITGNSTGDIVYYGGLCGQNTGTSDIINTTGDISGNATIRVTTPAPQYLGGMVGENSDTSNITSSFITYRNTLDISGISTGGGTNVYLGGLCGNNVNTSTITDTSGEIIGNTIYNITAPSNAYIGGLCGVNDTSCDISGSSVTYGGTFDITGTSNNDRLYLGGVCGHNLTNSTIVSTTGNISGNATFNTTSNLQQYVGGYCGINENAGDISGSSVTYGGTLDISGTSRANQLYLGGVCGNNNGAAITNTSGTIYGNAVLNGSAPNSRVDAGGFCGFNQSNSNITDCSIDISGNCTIIGDALTRCALGGFIGTSQVNTQVTKCSLLFKQSFDISGYSETDAYRVGCLIGSNFNNSDVSGISIVVDGNVTIRCSSSGLGGDVGGLIGTMGTFSSETSLNNTYIIINGTVSKYLSLLSSDPNNIINDGGLFGYIFSNTGVPSDIKISDISGEFIGNTLNIYDSQSNVISGGILGYIDSTDSVQKLNVLYNGDVDISSNSVYETYIGGICGLLLDNSIQNMNVDILGNATFSATSSSTNSYIGGVCGANISSSSITKLTTDICGNATFIGDASNNLFIGGYCGQNRNGSDISGGSVLYRNTLDITKSSITTNPFVYISGGIGQNVNSSVSNISSTIDTLNIHDVTANNEINIGLIAGSNSNSIIDTADVLVNTSYNVSDISGLLEVIGGLVGVNIYNTDGIRYIRDLSGTVTNYSITSLISSNNVYIGQIIADTLNNNINYPLSIEQCNINIDTYNCDLSGSSINNMYFGGLFGEIRQVGDVSGSGKNNINRCSGTTQNFTALLAGTNNVYIGGLVGTVTDNGSISGEIIFTNNSLTVGPNAIFRSLNDASGVYMGGIVAYINGSPLLGNNSITYDSCLTLQAQPATDPDILFINSDYGSGTPSETGPINVTFVTHPLEFQSFNTPSFGITFNGTDYSGIPAQIIYGDGFTIDLSGTRLYICLFTPPPPPPPQPSNVIPPCCVANTCNQNPQTSDYDTSVKANNQNGSALVKSVELYNEAVRLGIRTANSRPVFATYQAYIQYLQGQNKR